MKGLFLFDYKFYIIDLDDAAAQSELPTIFRLDSSKVVQVANWRQENRNFSDLLSEKIWVTQTVEALSWEEFRANEVATTTLPKALQSDLNMSASWMALQSSAWPLSFVKQCVQPPFPMSYRNATFTVWLNDGSVVNGNWVDDSLQYRAEGLRWKRHTNQVIAWQREPV